MPDGPDDQNEVVDLLGAEITQDQVSRERKNRPDSRINYFTLLITGIVFMLIVAWFDFVQTAFYFWYNRKAMEAQVGEVGPAGVFWFCVLGTALGLLLIWGLILTQKYFK